MNAPNRPIKLFGVPFSVHTRKVIIAARVKSVPLEIAPVAPVVPGSLPANWSSISPTGLIPAVDDGGYVLADSTAILLYLEREFVEPALLPAGSREYGRALFLDSWAGSALFRSVVHPIFHNRIVNPKIRGQACDKSAVSHALESAAPRAFEYLESLAPDAFLVGSRLSIADLAILSNLIVLQYLGQRVDPAHHPKLSAYFRRHVTSPLFRDVLAREKPFAEKMGLSFEA